MFGVLARIITALALGNRVDPISGAWDQVSYDLLAQRLLSGHGFSFPTVWYPFTQPDEQTAHWSFLYTLYLTGVYAVTGHYPVVARIIQAILSGLQIWLAYRLGWRLFGEWVGVAAAALTALYAYFIFFNAALMTQTFYIICVLAAIDIALGIRPRGTPVGRNSSQGGLPSVGIRNYLLLGLVLGLGALFRQTLLLFAPMLFLWLLVAGRSQAAGLTSQVAGGRAPGLPGGFSAVARRLPDWWRDRLPVIKGIGIACVVIAALLLPWTFRNYMVYHDFLLLNSNGGYWLYASNHPHQGTNFDSVYSPPIPDNLKGLGEPAIDRALYQQGMGFILADPTRFVLLSINRTKDYFWVGASDESSTISNLARLLSFTLYLPFFLYGLWLSRKNWRLCLPLYLYAAFDTILCLTTWSAPRYRLPTDAVLMTMAGLAVVDVATRLRLKFIHQHIGAVAEK
ncbi:MAG: glycosyltransferase family 39 protein [Anaerolineae bacterium]